ncbi:MAG TPA: ATP synthase subunit I, partial [Acidimicrobiales bacterium]|nr:ATP synthase subunit I [Acidimicrobiales bacterium]
MKTASLSTIRVDGPAPEADVAKDLARRAVPVIPVALLFGLIWGIDGALSAGFGLALVVVNFLLAAALIGQAAKISLTVLMVAVMGGYLVRLVVVFGAVLLVKDASWMELWPMSLTLVLSHVGLLWWETRYVSASLAYPGLKP